MEKSRNIQKNTEKTQKIIKINMRLSKSHYQKKYKSPFSGKDFESPIVKKGRRYLLWVSW